MLCLIVQVYIICGTAVGLSQIILLPMHFVLIIGQHQCARLCCQQTSVNKVSASNVLPAAFLLSVVCCQSICSEAL